MHEQVVEDFTFQVFEHQGLEDFLAWVGLLLFLLVWEEIFGALG